MSENDPYEGATAVAITTNLVIRYLLTDISDSKPDKQAFLNEMKSFLTTYIRREYSATETDKKLADNCTKTLRNMLVSAGWSG